MLELYGEGVIDLDTRYADATNIWASNAAAGANGGCQALGRSRGGFGTKLHLVGDGFGNPFLAVLTPGQKHESMVAQVLTGGVRVKIPKGSGRPRSHPKRVVADRSNDSIGFRRYLNGWGICGVIQEQGLPEGTKRRRRGRPPVFFAIAYRGRNVIERLVGWLKEHRRIATWFEKLARNFLAMVKLAFIRRHFRVSEPFSDPA